MEVTKRSMKGQLMTLSMLIIFVMMLAILLAYVSVTVNYNNIAQSVALSKTSVNYGQLLAPGLASLLQASASQAMYTLAVYEASPNLRGNNLITNVNQSLSSLITTGTLSGVATSSPGGSFVANSMGDLTLSSYNSVLLQETIYGYSYNAVSITQTPVTITQSSPYSISVGLTDTVVINATGGVYTYHIPVNVTVPINGTYDLYDAQLGTLRSINLATPARAVVIGGANAVYGNSTGFVYGTFYSIPGSLTCTELSGNIPVSLNEAPLNKSIILVTTQATSLFTGGCSNKFGGLITNSLPTFGAHNAIPYLVYPSTVSLSDFLTGETGLLYGPLLSTLNITGMQSQVTNGDFYASGYTPSYASRALEEFTNASPYGLFTLQGFDYQAASFQGIGYILIPAISSYSNRDGLSLWARTQSNSQQQLFNGGTCVAGATGDDAYSLFSDSMTINGLANNGILVDFGPDSVFVPYNGITNGGWHNVVTSWSGSQLYVGVDGSLPSGYVWNGVGYALQATQPFTLMNTPAPSSLLGDLSLGYEYGCLTTYPLTGQLSNVQLYDSSLSPNQIYSIYQGGAYGIPPLPKLLAGWWPLNGNANDNSGGANNGIPTNMGYVLLQNYSVDSIFNTHLSSINSKPVPGVLSCTSNSQCQSSALPNLYIGTSPLANGGRILVPYFNGVNSYEASHSDGISVLPQYKLAAGSLFAWAKTTSADDMIVEIQNGTPLVYLEVGATTAGGNANQFTAYLRSSTGYRVIPFSSLTYINDNAWRQLGVTWNGATATLYLNGTPVASNTFTGTINLQDGNVIFGSYQGSEYYLTGSIADVQLYNQSLTGNQVSALYREGLLGTPLASANVVGWWPLTGNGNDYSGLGLNLTTNTGVSYIYLNSSNILPGLQKVQTTETESQFFGFT